MFEGIWIKGLQDQSFRIIRDNYGAEDSRGFDCGELFEYKEESET